MTLELSAHAIGFLQALQGVAMSRCGRIWLVSAQIRRKREITDLITLYHFVNGLHYVDERYYVW